MCIKIFIIYVHFFFFLIRTAYFFCTLSSHNFDAVSTFPMCIRKAFTKVQSLIDSELLPNFIELLSLNVGINTRFVITVLSIDVLL